MIDLKRKVDHPAHKTNLEKCGNVVVCFKVGRYVDAPREAKMAELRIRHALTTISKEDMTLFQQWGGSVVFYPMTSKVDNPETTEEMKDAFRAAAIAAYPELKLINSWENAMNGLHGFSVEMG